MTARVGATSPRTPIKQQASHRFISMSRRRTLPFCFFGVWKVTDLPVLTGDVLAAWAPGDAASFFGQPLARWPFSWQCQQTISSSGVPGPFESFAGDIFTVPIGTCSIFRVAAAVAAGAEDLFAPAAATAAPAFFLVDPSS